MTLKWVDKMKEARQKRQRNVFILHFNIRDLVFDPQNLPSTPPHELPDIRDYVQTLTKNSRDWVIRYSLSEGIIYEVANRGDKPTLRNRTEPRFAIEAAAKYPFPLTNNPNASNDSDPQRWRNPESIWNLLNRLITEEWYTGGQPLTQVAEPGNTVDPVKFSLVIDYLDHLIPAHITNVAQLNAVEIMLRWSVSRTLQKTGSIVVGLTTELEQIHRDLYGADSRIEVIEVPWPEREERLAFLNYLSQYDGFNGLAQTDDNENHRINEVANRTSGMNFLEIRDFARIIDDSNRWQEDLRQRREEIIARQSGNLLVPRFSKYGLSNVAGYDYVNDFILPRLKQLRAGRIDVPGILFTGPPGTGKSFYASALARDAGVEMVTMSSIRGSYVGESERNFERILRVATNLSPVIIFVDEIDQQFSNNRSAGGDGGVEQRLFGRFLEFMDDKNNLGKVLWIAATNKPNTLDPALKSRFRLRIPFLLPDTQSISEMLKMQIPTQAGFVWGNWEEYESQVLELVRKVMVGKFSGREIEQIVRNALLRAQKADDSLSAADLPQISTEYLVESITSANIGHPHLEYELWSLYALQSIPENTTSLTNAVREVMPTYATRILDSEGLIIADAVSECIDDIQQLRGY
jgi:hypothetical protein